MRTKTYVEIKKGEKGEKFICVSPCPEDVANAKRLVEKHGFKWVKFTVYKLLMWGDLTVLIELFPNAHYGQELLRAKEERELTK